MEIARCKECGRLFKKNLDSIELCPACLEAKEKEFLKVKEFFLKNPRSTIEEASKATGVDRKDILYFLKEGRLQVAQDAQNIDTGLKCERCGKPIFSGRFCEKCRLQLSYLLREKTGAGSSNQQGESRFYFRDAILRKKKKPAD
ncbi:MAG: MerR family transcriptional regulator [Candidatus Atribacteria bacterium]|nr:MerR family transcriptional regulator [Candidatus Atribacteria bacterium]MCD6350361.1 MerR family transcriptional regulator [Candidatus Atribacteria bacterium]